MSAEHYSIIWSWYRNYDNVLRYYTSVDGGHSFIRNTSMVSGDIQTLPLCNKIIGLKSQALGYYEFTGQDNWQSFGNSTASANMFWGEVDANTLFVYNYDQGKFFTRPVSNATYTQVATFSMSFNGGGDVHTKGNRIFLGGSIGGTATISYVDNGDFSNIQSATINGIVSSSLVMRFFESGGALYAVIYKGYGENLFKTTDNGATWTEVSNPTPLEYGIGTIIGTPDGRIFYTEYNGVNSIANLKKVYVSTDGGASANQIATGLPDEDATGIIFNSGNKLLLWAWRNDFMNELAVDPIVTGIYQLDANTIGVSSLDEKNVSLIVSPNPANDIVTISNLPQEATVKLYDLNGKIIHNETVSNKQTIHTENIQPGVYFISVEHKGIKTTEKLIIH